MKIKIPISEKLAGRILILFFSACVLVNLVLCFSRGSIASIAYNVIFKGKQDALLCPIDNLFSKFECGRLFLKFEGFNAQSETSKRIVQMVYFRAVFKYYPGQIIIGDPDLVIKEGNEFLKNQFIPGDEWLRTNNFNYLLIFHEGEKGAISYDVREVK